MSWTSPLEPPPWASPCPPQAPSIGDPLTGAQGAGQLLVAIEEGKLGAPEEWKDVGEGDGLGSSILKPQGQHLLALQIQVDKELPIPVFMRPLDFHVYPMLPVKVLSPGKSGSQGGAGARGSCLDVALGKVLGWGGWPSSSGAGQHTPTLDQLAPSPSSPCSLRVGASPQHSLSQTAPPTHTPTHLS